MSLSRLGAQQGEAIYEENKEECDVSTIRSNEALNIEALVKDLVAQ